MRTPRLVLLYAVHAIRDQPFTQLYPSTLFKVLVPGIGPDWCQSARAHLRSLGRPLIPL